MQNPKRLFSEPPLKQKSGSSGPFFRFLLFINSAYTIFYLSIFGEGKFQRTQRKITLMIHKQKTRGKNAFQGDSKALAIVHPQPFRSEADSIYFISDYLKCHVTLSWCPVLKDSSRTARSKYLLLTEFEVRTVSYGPSFFPSIYGPSAKRAGPKS